MSAHDLRQCLCLVTDRGFRPSVEYLRTVELAIDHGVTMVQYREKADQLGHTSLNDRESYKLGCQLRKLTADKGVQLVVNDRLDLAMAIDADGIHLGQHDLPLDVVKALWKPDRIYGLSVSTPIEAKRAFSLGADYIGVGAVFPTSTKLDAPSTGLAMLAQLVLESRLPVIAIGGIALTNAAQVVQTGCAGIAVVSAIWGAADPAAATRTLAAIVGSGPRRA